MQSNSPGKVVWLVIRLLFVFAGLLFLGRGGYGALSTESLLRESIATDGRIVSLERVHRVQRSGFKYLPVFRFTLENGQPFTVESRVGSNPPEFKLGEAVKVYYKRDHPEWAVINSMGQLWMDDVALGFAGVILTAFGTVFSRAGSGKRRIVIVAGDGVAIRR
jgi:Protein of unknown function (DUF3592)